MSYDHERGRRDLLSFEDAQPDNYWTTDLHIRRVVVHWAGQDTLEAWEPTFAAFGHECATVVDAAVNQNNLTHNLPVLDRFSPWGERIEEVEHHASFHIAGRAIYGSGLMAALGQPGGNTRCLTLFYLSSQNGEAGHNCPLACTAGAIKALRSAGSAELQQRYLPRFLSTDYALLAHGAQFLTEVQGGSDVGANSVRAVPEDPKAGTWRISGEKWFCSNVTADVILLTARPDGAPEGTKGLGLFLMPRRLDDGTLNNFEIRRLKDKIGTRTLPTAELDFDEALAWAVGPVEEGFRNVMNYVINTSRIFNAVGCAGMSRRACVVAGSFARFREAFGAPIAQYPMTQETLAEMRVETAAMVSGTFLLINELDRWERGEAGEGAAEFLRIALNLNKTRTALSSHEVVVSGIEVLAGNGTIETFSVLPRLLRDNVVFENWEGSHNVLFLQAMRDSKRKSMHVPFFARLHQLAQGHQRIEEAAKEVEATYRDLLEGDEAVASVRLRDVGSRMIWLLWGAAMHQDGTDAQVIDHFLDRRIGPAAPRDSAYLDRIANLASDSP
ncbi:acyl-CoA dehydrogenase family protein [Myxococcota bacterium]